MKLTDNSIMPLGQYRGKKLADVPAGRLLWLLDQDWCKKQYPDLIQYIRANKEVLEVESDENRDYKDDDD